MLTPLSGYPEYTHKARKAVGGINRTNDLDGTDGTHPHSCAEGGGLPPAPHGECRRRQNESFVHLFKGGRQTAPSESRARKRETPPQSPGSPLRRV